MAKCDARVLVVGDTTISLDVKKDGAQAASVNKLSISQFLVHKPDPPPALNFACRQEATTNQFPGGATLDKTVPPFVGSHYVGTLAEPLALTFSMDFYTDCTGPYCCKGQLKDIKANIVIAYLITLFPNITLFEVKCDFAPNPLQFDPQGCPTPPWSLCCEDSQSVELKYKTKLNPDVELSLEGSATIKYSIWHKSGQGAESSSGTYKKVSTRENGSAIFHLQPGTVHVHVPLPKELGGGAIKVNEVSGHAVVRPGPTAGHIQSFQISELSLSAPSIRLPDGRDSGPNQVVLAGGVESTGTLNLNTGAVEIDLAEIIVNDLFNLASPVRVRSRVVGFYDETSGEARIVSRASDKFPESTRTA